MNDDDLDHLRGLFERAIELPEGQREAFVEAECAGRPTLRAELLELLARDGEVTRSRSPVTPGLLASALGLRGKPVPREGRIGPYTLVRVLGAGGMGTVYEALQESPRRVVALKTLQGSAPTEAEARRLRLEAAVLGALNHPCIAHVFDAGVHTADGRAVPYFVMEYIEGARDLVTYAREEKLDEVRRLALFLDLVDAVGHGHSRGVVHRDLKPGNLLVDVHGRPKVIDFGIARAAGLDTTLTAADTRTGQVLGTLQYMSPEQLIGDMSRVGERSDVYSLGVVLHELLTGSLPYDLRDKPYPAIARIVAEQPVPRPSGLASDLGKVLQVCLAKDPDQRYASCAALAADLRRYLRHEAIHATGPSVTYRLRKFVRRQRIALVAASAVVIASAIGTYRARSEAETARREAAKSAGVSDFLRRVLTSAGPLSRGQDARVVEVLDEAARLIETELAGEPEAHAVVSNVLAECYAELRYFDRAQEYLTHAVRFVEREMAPDDPFTIDVRTIQGRTLFMRGDVESAEPILRDVERRALARYGPEDERTLRVQFSLDELLLATEQLEEASARYEAHLPLVARVFGETGGDTLGYLGGRALTWCELGRVAEAHAEFERILGLAKSSLPRGHFRIANATYNLALTELVSMQDPERARPRLAALYDDLRSEFGDDHPMLVPALVALGRSERLLGNQAEALRRFEAALAALEASDRADTEDRRALEAEIQQLRGAAAETR